MYRGRFREGSALSSIPITKDLQLDEDMPFQRREWIVQRVGWGIMALVVLLALLGVLGPGPFSSTVTGEKDGALWVQHNRWGRFQTPQRLHVHWGPGAADADGVVRVWVNKDYFVRNTLEQIVPQPKGTLSGEDRITFEFQPRAPDKPGSAILHVRTDHIGRCDAQIGVAGGGGGARIRFWQFVYP